MEICFFQTRICSTEMVRPFLVAPGLNGLIKEVFPVSGGHGGGGGQPGLDWSQDK